MGQQDKGIRILVVDRDARLRHEMESALKVGVELAFLAVAAAKHAPVNFHDVIIVDVDSAAGLALVTDLCGRDDAPPVIAVSGTGFDGKSPEHLLILAELRGAAALPKPVEAGEVVMVATNLAALRRRRRAGLSESDRTPFDQAC